ncbi:MAG TPA: cytidine deaminase [Kofleriaceae bacterium]|nr:cytidine deaminase [Kofleriaceae bacterium]
MTTSPPGKPPTEPPTNAALDARAIEAQQLAYAPYSKFRVGAAVQMSGEVFSGANVENASYGLTICAERVAVFSAAIAGKHELEAIAVCSDASPPSSPCGACRQVLLEFARDPAAVTVTAINPAGERRSWTLAELIPDGFSGRELP